MDYDFSKPHRQSAHGIIIMTASTLIKITRALIFPIVIAFVKFKTVSVLYFLLAILVIVLVSLLFAYLWYLKFTFFLNKEKQEFVIHKGIINKDQVTIQLDKIQQVNINQSILQKIIGVYGLKIDTAGAHGEEVSIKAIDEASAYNLKAHLLNRATSASPVEEETKQIQPETLPFLKISALTLFKVGLTSNYGQSLTLLAAFFYFVFHNLREFMNIYEVDKGRVESALTGLTTFFSVSVLIIIFLVALLVINLVRTFVKYFELEISKHQHSLLISSGLFAKKNTLVSPDKVQITAYSQNYFQKKMNMFNVRLKQAKNGHAKNGKELHGSTLEVPGCNVTERDELIKMILGKIPASAKLFIPNWRFLNLPIFFNLVLPIAIFLIIGFNVPQIKPFLPLASVYFLIGVLMIYISYKRHRINVNEEFIIKKSGIWDISHEIITPNKIQAITTFQYPWHKSVDVGHLCLHTAAGQIRFKYGNYTEIKNLVNYWLYQIESGDQDWM
ncbi:PH domain-containing protein [Pedobacter punctiformis]|uniref:PH domain-containing protein n=1 Tax=Pedobacter punctiformis TaxID=3004097 RepID=A0ABT4LAR4_9SPHI|nr:PH domain-containing protein [Pedobacter sp. HCMS5-2]MCZ4245010.1 PH domain-containing protein [Pedobacter sp. HCMS5-2]